MFCFTSGLKFADGTGLWRKGSWKRKLKSLRLQKVKTEVSVWMFYVFQDKNYLKFTKIPILNFLFFIFMFVSWSQMYVQIFELDLKKIKSFCPWTPITPLKILSKQNFHFIKLSQKLFSFLSKRKEIKFAKEFN